MARDAYEDKNWAAVVEHMQLSLTSYHLAYENCSLLCETGYDVITSPNKDSNHELYGSFAGKNYEIDKFLS